VCCNARARCGSERRVRPADIAPDGLEFRL
jgi:hypothetical protein